MHTILRDFELQTDHQTSAKRPNLELINENKGLVILWILLFQWIIAKIIDK